MTSEERRAARYERRIAKRLAQKEKRMKNADCFESAFSYSHLYTSYRRCRGGVSWKDSVQRYITNAPIKVLDTYDMLRDGKYKSPVFREFDLNQRGKLRHIRSTKFGERVIQRCLGDRSLNPQISRSFIYDNGACMKDKGYDFSMDRILRHLREHIRNYGREGYILLYDFKKFYDNIPHDIVYDVVDNAVTDDRIRNMTRLIVDAYGDKGIGLGSPISPVLALSSANRLDHYIKEVLRIRHYGRYSDDGYLIHPSKEYLKECLERIKTVCERLGIVLNEKKTQIVKLSHGFKWLKIRFFITETGKVIRKMNKDNITRARRKLKKMQTKWLNHEIPLDSIQNMAKCWRGNIEKYSSHFTICNYDKLFNELFIFIPWEVEHYDLCQNCA